MKHLLFMNQATGVPVGERIRPADTSRSRLVGLLGRDRLETGGGIWIRPSSGIHTFGMRFAIDVIGLDRAMRVVRLWRDVKPNALPRFSLQVKSILEVEAGQITRQAIRIGDQLAILLPSSSSAPEPRFATPQVTGLPSRSNQHPGPALP